MPQSPDKDRKSTTEIAQDLRQKVIRFTRDKIYDEVDFTVPQFNQAWATNQQLIDGMRANDMGIMIIPNEGKVLIKTFKRNIGEIDLLYVVGNPDAQVRILSAWYEELYRSSQAGEFEQSSLTFAKMTAPLGITDEDLDQVPPDIFLDYPEHHSVRQSATILRKTLERILTNSGSGSIDQVSLGYQETERLLLNIWNLIGEINPNAQQRLNATAPYVTHASASAVEHHLDIQP